MSEIPDVGAFESKDETEQGTANSERGSLNQRMEEGSLGQGADRNEEGVGPREAADSTRDTDKVQHVRDARDHSLRREEVLEREALSTLADRVAFPFGGDNTTLDQVQRALNSLSPEVLGNSSSTLFLVATASRVGNRGENQSLSERRGENVRAIIEEHRESLHIAARIEVVAKGEDKARQEGRPDGCDDRDDRAVQFVLAGHPVEKDIPRISESDASKMVDQLLDAASVEDISKVDAFKEARERGIEVAEKAVGIGKDIVREKYWSVIGKTLSLQMKTLSESQQHKEYRENVSANLIPSFHQQLDRMTLGFPDHQGPHVASPYNGYSERQREAALKAVEGGALIVNHGLGNFTAEQLSLFKQVMKDENNRALIHHAADRALHQRLNH